MSKKNVTDLSYLNEASAGNIKFVKEMVEVFLKQTPGFVEILKKTSSSKDWEEFRKVVHKIKPTLTMMGISELKEDINFLELNVKKNLYLEKVPEVVSRIEELCTQSYDELKQELKKMA